jgi:hypothetical protein
MPKSHIKTRKVYGESQGALYSKCEYEEDMRTFPNQRTYILWRKFHDKRCKCADKEQITNLETIKKIGDKLGVKPENAYKFCTKV